MPFSSSSTVLCRRSRHRSRRRTSKTRYRDEIKKCATAVWLTLCAHHACAVPRRRAKAAWMAPPRTLDARLRRLASGVENACVSVRSRHSFSNGGRPRSVGSHALAREFEQARVRRAVSVLHGDGEVPALASHAEAAISASLENFLLDCIARMARARNVRSKVICDVPTLASWR